MKTDDPGRWAGYTVRCSACGVPAILTNVTLDEVRDRMRQLGWLIGAEDLPDFTACPDCQTSDFRP